jgi:hypothetical protein
VNAPKWAARATEVALFFVMSALFTCAVYMSRVGCPACLPEFSSNGVKLDVLALELPANGDELRRILYLGKSYSSAVRDVYEKQTKVDDVFLWLYPAQFVLACFYFSLPGLKKASQLLLIAASLAMIIAGWLDHQENSLIHAILKDSGAHLNLLALAVRGVSMQKWLSFGVAAFLAAVGLALQTHGDGPASFTKSAVAFVCTILVLVSVLTAVGLAGNREVIGWSAWAYSLFPVSLLWLLYLKPWAEQIDAQLRVRLGLRHPKVK